MEASLEYMFSCQNMKKRKKINYWKLELIQIYKKYITVEVVKSRQDDEMKKLVSKKERWKKYKPDHLSVRHYAKYFIHIYSPEQFYEETRDFKKLSLSLFLWKSIPIPSLPF